MITQKDIHKSFEIGQDRMRDVCELIEDDTLGQAEIVGMMMGAMAAHAKRRGKTMLESAIELAELVEAKEEMEDEDD